MIDFYLVLFIYYIFTLITKIAGALPRYLSYSLVSGSVKDFSQIGLQALG